MEDIPIEDISIPYLGLRGRERSRPRAPGVPEGRGEAGRGVSSPLCLLTPWFTSLQAWRVAMETDGGGDLGPLLRASAHPPAFAPVVPLPGTSSYWVPGVLQEEPGVPAFPGAGFAVSPPSSTSRSFPASSCSCCGLLLLFSSSWIDPFWFCFQSFPCGFRGDAEKSEMTCIWLTTSSQVQHLSEA